VTEALVGRRARAVVRVRRGREPSLVDAAAMPSKRIQIVRVQFETAPGQHERTGHPRGLEPEDSRSGVDRFLNCRTIQHAFEPRRGKPAAACVTILGWPGSGKEGRSVAAHFTLKD